MTTLPFTNGTQHAVRTYAVRFLIGAFILFLIYVIVPLFFLLPGAGVTVGVLVIAVGPATAVGLVLRTRHRRQATRMRGALNERDYRTELERERFLRTEFQLHETMRELMAARNELARLMGTQLPVPELAPRRRVSRRPSGRISDPLAASPASDEPVPAIHDQLRGDPPTSRALPLPYAGTRFFLRPPTLEPGRHGVPVIPGTPVLISEGIWLLLTEGEPGEVLMDVVTEHSGWPDERPRLTEPADQSVDLRSTERTVRNEWDLGDV